MAHAQTRQADPRALAVARRAQALTGAEQVILFGSRARGDWRRDSDIDLMVVEEHLPRSRRLELMELRRQLERDAVDLYPDRNPVRVQLLYLTRAEFEQARRAPTHVAGGAQRDGLTPGGASLPPVSQNDPWPAVRNFLQRSFLSLADALAAEGDGGHLEAALDVYHAFKLVLKAYVSALGYTGYLKLHNLNELIGMARRYEHTVDFTHTDAAWCKEMLEIRYNGPYERHYSLFREADDLIDTVQQVGGAVVVRTLQVMTKTPADVGYAYAQDPAKYPAINHDRPWGGLEDAYPHRFSSAYREEQARVAERAAALQAVVRSLHGPDGAERLAECLDAAQPDAWPTIDDIVQGRWTPDADA